MKLEVKKNGDEVAVCEKCGRVFLQILRDGSFLSFIWFENSTKSMKCSTERGEISNEFDQCVFYYVKSKTLIAECVCGDEHKMLVKYGDCIKQCGMDFSSSTAPKEIEVLK